MAEVLPRSPSGASIGWRGYALLVLLCLALFVPGQTSLPPTDRDESLFAQATKQMIETQDYVNINFLGTPRYKKPVGIYWLQAAAVQILNPHHLDEIWAYRVPSLLGAMAAVLFTAALGALLFTPEIGVIAGVMLACCVDLNVEAHIAKTDAALLASVMMAQYALARAYKLRETGWGTFLLFWGALGLGALLKGPIILLPVLSTLLVLRYKEKNLDWFWRLKPMLGLPLALLLVTPWFAAINLASHGKFTAQSGGHDFLAKIWQGQDRGHIPPGAHALVFTAMFFPFSLFALLAVPDIWKRRNEDGFRFCVAWLVPTWMVFELSLTKLPHYVLPAYPAIAILSAKAMSDGFLALTELKRRWYPVAAVGFWCLVGMILPVAAAAAPALINGKADLAQIAGSAFLLVSEGVTLLFYLQQQRRKAIGALALGTVVFSLTLFLWAVPSLDHVWISRAIVNEARTIKPCDELRIVSAGYEEPSLAFLAGTGTKLVPNGDYAASEMHKDACRVGVINKNALKDFLLSSGDRDIQPVPVGGTVRGVSTGNGGGMELFFYVMPQKHQSLPSYP